VVNLFGSTRYLLELVKISSLLLLLLEVVPPISPLGVVAEGSTLGEFELSLLLPLVF